MRYRFTVAGRRYLQAPSLLLLGQYSTSFHDTDLLVIQLLRFTCSNFLFFDLFFLLYQIIHPWFLFLFLLRPYLSHSICGARASPLKLYSTETRRTHIICCQLFVLFTVLLTLLYLFAFSVLFSTTFLYVTWHSLAALLFSPSIHSLKRILHTWLLANGVFFFCIIRAVTVLHRKIHCFLSMGVVLVKEVRLRGLFTIRYIALI